MHVHTATYTTIDKVPGSGGKLTPNQKMGKLTSLRRGQLFHIFYRYDASHAVFPLPFLPSLTLFLPWRRFGDGFAGSHVRCLGGIQQPLYTLGHYANSGLHSSKTCEKHDCRSLPEHEL
ncbi:hypothetical protein TNCV_2496841 [Trichonephila clavipes]|nr:hypothetical protein TNCV_2496841 [Trichonephila clavipes]